MTQLLLTAVGADRAGLVSDLSEIVVNYDGNWLDSRMARLAGAFAGIVLVDIKSSKVEPLKADLAGLEVKGLRVTVTDTPRSRMRARLPWWFTSSATTIRASSIK